MSNYNINWQSNASEGIPGKETIVLPANNINDSSTSLALTGRGIPNYGEIQQENFIKLLENFASSTAPAHPTIGQLWYNTGESVLYVKVDPAIVSGGVHPGWMQVYSSSSPQQVVFAGLKEYTPVAAALNKIIGLPTGVSGGQPTPELIAAEPPTATATTQLYVDGPGTQTIDSFDTREFLSAKYQIEINDGIETNIVEFVVAHNGRGGNSILTYISRTSSPGISVGTFTSVWQDTDTVQQADGTLAELKAIISIRYTSPSSRRQVLKIIRTAAGPVPSSISPDVADTVHGWGQSDLVPEYTNETTLAPGFSSAIFPSTFSNNAWVILLSRLRRALSHVGLPHELAPPVGFISDGQPAGSGSPLANSYNTYPGHLPNYTAGFGGAGSMALQTYYAQLMTAISQLKERRFNTTFSGTEFSTLSSHVRHSAWTGQITHTMEVMFANYAAACAYFNSGGYLKFNWAHAPNPTNPLNVSWQNFLSLETGVIFDYKQMRRAAVVEPVNTAFGDSRGFYDLAAGGGLIFERDRNHPGTSMYGGISEGGLSITAFDSGNHDVAGTAPFTITFHVIFNETTGTVQGTTTSALLGFKPNNHHINSPIISQPVVTNSGDFTNFSIY